MTIARSAVREAYVQAKPDWNAPADADCDSLADTLGMYRQVRKERQQLRAGKPSVGGLKRKAAHARAREAIGTLLRDLPGIADWAQEHVRPGTAADTLRDLLAATQRAASAWPHLDGTLRKFDPRSEWARCADCVIGQIHRAWQAANPDRKIGEPKGIDQPMTRLLSALLAHAGYSVTAEQIAQHFTRNPRQKNLS